MLTANVMIIFGIAVVYFAPKKYSKTEGTDMLEILIALHKQLRHTQLTIEGQMDYLTENGITEEFKTSLTELKTLVTQLLNEYQDGGV